MNPAAYGLVVVTSSEGRNLPYGRLEDILSRDSSALNCHTNDDKNAWFAIDLGLWVIPSAYTLRHARGYGRSALRNWVFQVSKDGQNWMTLYTHVDDSSLNEPGYVCYNQYFGVCYDCALFTFFFCEPTNMTHLIALGRQPHGHWIHPKMRSRAGDTFVLNRWGRMLADKHTTSPCLV